MHLLVIVCHCNFFKIFGEKSLIIFCYDALIKVCLLKIDHFPKIVDHNDGALCNLEVSFHNWFILKCFFTFKSKMRQLWLEVVYLSVVTQKLLWRKKVPCPIKVEHDQIKIVKFVASRKKAILWLKFLACFGSCKSIIILLAEAKNIPGKKGDIEHNVGKIILVVVDPHRRSLKDELDQQQKFKIGVKVIMFLAHCKRNEEGVQGGQISVWPLIMESRHNKSWLAEWII